MWLQEKALSSRALPPDRSPNCDPARGQATQEPRHGLLDRGPTWKRSSQGHWRGPCGAHAHGLRCGNIGLLFLSGGKFSLILLTNSWAVGGGCAPKSVLRLQAGNVGCAGKLRN